MSKQVQFFSLHRHADPFKFEKVCTTYVGLDHACRCGCKGKYADPTEPPEYATAKRRWKQVMHQHTMFPLDVEAGMSGEFYMNYSYGNNRAVSVYFKCE
jgi:hypothetical protein